MKTETFTAETQRTQSKAGMKGSSQGDGGMHFGDTAKAKAVATDDPDIPG